MPLDTLKTVVDLAVEIGREGREGKPVGTMFVIGDTRKVLQFCHPAGFDPVRGHKRAERDLHDARTREAVKEIAQLDGAIIVTADGKVERACQIVDASHANLTLSKGLGTRHWAGAAISRVTKAISVVVSETNGTVASVHQWRSHAAHRTVPPRDEVERLRLRTALHDLRESGPVAGRSGGVESREWRVESGEWRWRVEELA